MVSVRHLCVGFAIAGLLLSGQSWAADGKTSEDVKSSLDEKYVSAATIDFVKALKLSTPSARTIGSRIEEARCVPDPIGLAATARELAALEAATGSQAAVKAADVMTEAVNLAKARGRSLELKAVAALVNDGTVAEELAAAAKKSQKAEAERAARAKDGEVIRGICGKLHVENHTHQHMNIYYNGSHIGCVAGYSCGDFNLEDHNHVFTLEARGDCGGYARRQFHGQSDNFNWRLWSVASPSGGHIH